MDARLTSDRVVTVAAATPFRLLYDFRRLSGYEQRRLEPGVLDFTFGDPHDLPSEAYVEILRESLLAPLCFGAAYWVELVTDGLPAIVQLALGVAAGVVPLLACLAIPAYRRDLAQIVGFVKQVRKPRPATSETSSAPDETAASGPASTSDVDEVIRDDAEFNRERKAGA